MGPLCAVLVARIHNHRFSRLTLAQFQDSPSSQVYSSWHIAIDCFKEFWCYSWKSCNVGDGRLFFDDWSPVRSAKTEEYFIKAASTRLAIFAALEGSMSTFSTCWYSFRVLGDKKEVGKFDHYFILFFFTKMLFTVYFTTWSRHGDKNNQLASTSYCQLCEYYRAENEI